MAYQARRFKKVIEDFELVDENNQIIERLHVELDAGSTVEKIRQKYIKLVRANREIQNVHTDINSEEEILNAYSFLGTAVSDLIEAVFGKEDTEKILKFYENNYVELSQEVIPFITQVVLPKLNEVAKQNKQNILSGYNRKQQRMLSKKGMFKWGS